MTALTRRLVVAAWGIPLLLLSTYAGGWPFRVVAAALSALAIQEALRLFDPSCSRLTRLVLQGVAVVAILGVQADRPLYLVALYGLASLAVAALTLGGRVDGRARQASVSLAALVYPLLPLVHFAWLREVHGWPVTWLLLGLLWVGDTAAYAGGRLTGRRKLAPLVSPNKTVEGALWALLFTGGAAVLARAWWADPTPSLLWFLAAGFTVWFFGTLGDLFESMLKRAAGVKDSSTLLSEHGGVLDRFDSLLFASMPLYYLGYWAT